MISNTNKNWTTLISPNKSLIKYLSEFSDTQQPSPWGDLIAVRVADLGSGKRELAPIVVQQVPKVDKDALGGLRPEVPDGISAGSDGRLEHQVEGKGGADVVPGIGRLAAVFLYKAWHLHGLHEIILG